MIALDIPIPSLDRKRVVAGPDTVACGLGRLVGKRFEVVVNNAGPSPVLVEFGVVTPEGAPWYSDPIEIPPGYPMDVRLMTGDPEDQWYVACLSDDRTAALDLLIWPWST